MNPTTGFVQQRPGNRPAAPAAAGAPPIEIVILDGVRPLAAARFGEDAAEVPDALRAPLTEGEGQLYAILDAGRICGLPDLLEMSGHDHVCLYDDGPGIG